MSTSPNIVFILTDQWRGDCLGVTGHPVVETPNLDDLAHRGAVFTAAYSSCPSCIATRASLFTGLSPSSHGRLGYDDCVPWRYPNMLPAVLGHAGYQTHCIGKTHFFPQRAHLGFDSLETYEGSQSFDPHFVNDYYEWLREQSGGRFTHDHQSGLHHNSWVARPSPLPEELHNNTWVVTRAMEFLRRRDPTRPFFLNLSFHRPHPPIDPPQAYWDMYRDAPLPPVPVGDWAMRHDIPLSDINAWHGRFPDRALARCRRAYYAQIAHIDNQIGRFILALQKANAGSTWFVFTSDHGEMLGDHHLFRKAYAYEGSAKVPLIITPPRKAQPHVCATPSVSEDLYTTMLDIAGVTPAGAVEGRSLLPCLEGKEIADRPYVHGEHSACYDPGNAMQFLTDGREKYVWFTISGEEQLFDLSGDPRETHDLAKDAAARDRLETWRRRMVTELARRPQDGLTDGRRLIPGKLPAVRPELKA
jgi:arylsulfatase